MKLIKAYKIFTEVKKKIKLLKETHRYTALFLFHDFQLYTQTPRKFATVGNTMLDCLCIQSESRIDNSQPT